MKINAGFVGFDGTENKRTILATQMVKEAAGIGGDLNLLLRRPHARARAMLCKLLRICKINAYLTSEDDRARWERSGAVIQGGYDDFFEASDFVILGTPGDQETPYIEAGLKHDCFIALMGGANRSAIAGELTKRGVEITDSLEKDIKREFFFGLENYEQFLKAKPKLVQCTSCNTTGISRASLAARPLGLQAILGNIDRRHGDPHTVVRASPSAVQFGRGVGHQGTDAGTVFEDVLYSIRASKIPTTVPHTHFLNLVLKGEHSAEELREQLSRTRRIVVIPYEDEGRRHEWTSEILEGFLSGFERPISPEIFELLVSDAIIPVKLGDYTIMQTVMMVEQMSIAVPNHVEAFLLSGGFSADKVHKTVDEAIGCVHGVWPDKLST